VAALSGGVVTDTPETHYTRSADGTNLAYQITGDGPIDLVFCHWAPPIDLLPDDPGFVRVRRRLGTFSRTLWFDPRGMGASEGDHRGTRAGDMYDGDLATLLAAVGFERPAIVGNGQSGPAAIHFAVAHPERVSALVLVNTYAHYLREDDYPWGFHRQDLEVTVARGAILDAAASLERLAPAGSRTNASELGSPARSDFVVGPTRSPTSSDSTSKTMYARFSPPFRFRPSSCIVRETVTCAWALAGTWLSTSPMPSSSFSPATTMSSSWVTPTPWWTR
jgi:pimeloyl-ACP methyl ester carboxylesterase